MAAFIKCMVLVRLFLHLCVCCSLISFRKEFMLTLFPLLFVYGSALMFPAFGSMWTRDRNTDAFYLALPIAAMSTLFSIVISGLPPRGPSRALPAPARRSLRPPSSPSPSRQPATDNSPRLEPMVATASIANMEQRREIDSPQPQQQSVEAEGKRADQPSPERLANAQSSSGAVSESSASAQPTQQQGPADAGEFEHFDEAEWQALRRLSQQRKQSDGAAVTTSTPSARRELLAVPGQAANGSMQSRPPFRPQVTLARVRTGSSSSLNSAGSGEGGSASGAVTAAEAIRYQRSEALSARLLVQQERKNQLKREKRAAVLFRAAAAGTLGVLLTYPLTELFSFAPDQSSMAVISHTLGLWLSYIMFSTLFLYSCLRFMYDHWFARTEERVQGRRFSSFAFYWVLGWRLLLYVPAFITVADYELKHSANTENGVCLVCLFD